MKIIKHNTIDELKKEIKRTEPNRYKIRLQTILLSMQKTFYKDILKTLSISSRSYYSTFKPEVQFLNIEIIQI